MTDADPGEEGMLFPKTAGERLREGRESQGLTLAEIAARTRIPVRHLEAIEKSNYAGLPSPTYSVGFAKAYARAIGMDEVVIGRDVRGQTDKVHRPPEYQPYEMQDPKRLPPPGVALAGTIAAILVLIAVGLWYGTTWFRGDGEPVAGPPPAAILPTPIAPQSSPTPVTSGQVTLMATDVVWLRIYDADGKTLYEAEMQPGERYDVPADANQPMINVGRPDKLQVLVNGSIVPPLGDGTRAIKDVGISAQALLDRGKTDASATSSTVPSAGVTKAPLTAPTTTPSPKPSASPPSKAVTSRPSPQRPAATPTAQAPAIGAPEPQALPTTADPQTGEVN